MQIRFDGRTAVVTGAAHGFGRSIALNFANLGARVVACDVLKSELDETAQLAKEQGTPLEVRVLDVSDRAAVHAMVAETVKAREYCAEAARFAAGHCQRRPIFCERASGLDHRPDPVHRRWTVSPSQDKGHRHAESVAYSGYQRHYRSGVIDL